MTGDGLVVTVTSVAALHRTHRGELLGQPVRLTEVAPGAVRTEGDGDDQAEQDRAQS